MFTKRARTRGGFVVMEVVLAVGVIAALTGSVAALWGSRKSLPPVRDLQRVSDADVILKAISRNAAANGGVFKCAQGAVPLVPTAMASGKGDYNIAPCLVPSQLPALPFDPSMPGAHWASVANYNTGYTVVRDTKTNRVTIQAPTAELQEDISVTR
ncbi:MAG: hypothetical protein HYW65_02220 [Candidatus Liptonbacteria bacterium]|nr:hypothetical protein [Candidatus Liptonbacteria bacterium]